MLRYCDFRIDGGSLQQLPDGSIKVQGQLTRPGIFSYRNDNGTERREYRPADEVFRKAALDTFANTSITINHPRTPTGQRLVTPVTWRGVTIGHVGENVREDGGHVVADLYVKDAGAIARIQKGDLRHISCGYNVDYDPTPGTTPEGQRYDGVQRNIRGNHVALLPNGIAPRGGDQCVLRLDAAGDEVVPLNSDVDLETLQAQLTAAKAELATARADAAALPGVKKNLETANAKIVALEAELAPERMDALVADRVAAVALAKSLGVEIAGKSTLAIKRACVAKKTPELATRADSMSSDAVDAVLTVYGAQPHATLAAAAAVTNPGADDKARTDAASASDRIPTVTELHDKFRKEQANAWKGGSN